MKIILFYFISFMLFYLDPIKIGFIKFSIIWKIPIVFIFAFIALYLISKNNKIPKFAIYGFLYSIKKFFSLSALSYLSITISEFVKGSVFYFFVYSFPYLFKFNTLVSFGKHLSIFIVISFLPFMLGIINSLGEGYQLSAYGLDEEGLVGVFQYPHSASISLAFAIIVIYFLFTEEKKYLYKFFYFSLIILGLIAMYLTYVRTGLAMLFVSFAYLLLWKKNLKYYFKILPWILVLSVAVFYLYEHNEVFQMRIQDRNIYIDEGHFGSGRLLFGYLAIMHWIDNGPLSWLFGLGMEYAKDLMELDTGLHVFAHNGYIESLQSDGLIGFVLYLLMLFYLFKYIFQYRTSRYYKISMAMYLSLLVEILFQGGNYFAVYLLFAIYLSLLKMSKKERT